ncbi:PspC domain-containing protein [Kitasatospora indigofera]|uniref:PspC domain-containing protein n=2 Tax=Kitasatospora indigofera TaxID=67307 RepID=UPI00364B160C
MTDDHQTPGAGPLSPPETERPPLTRSEHHRVVAGVCGGLGRHLDIDPVVFRVVIAVLCLSGGLGLFLYGLAWLVMPAEPREGREGRTELQRVLTGRVDGQSIGAVLLTVIGTGVFFSSMGDGDQLFPLLLLGGLVFLAVRHDPEHRRGGRQRRRRRGRRHGGPYDRLYPQAPFQDGPAVAGGPAGAEDRQDAEARARHAREREAGTVPLDTPHPGPTGYLWDPRHPERNPYAGPYPGPAAAPGAPARPWWQRTDLPEGDPLRKGPAPARAGRPSPPARCRDRSSLGTLGLLVTLGVCAAVWVRPGGLGKDVLLTTVMAALLLGIGLTLLVGAKFGRARGLVVPALLLTVALASTGHSRATVGDAFGDRVWAPATAGELHGEYRLGAGSATLDLRGLDPAGGTLSTTARVGAGDLTVLVPPDVVVEVRARHILGNVQITGIDDTGDSNDRTYELHPLNGQAPKGTLDLTLTVGLGDIKVVQA